MTNLLPSPLLAVRQAAGFVTSKFSEISSLYDRETGECAHASSPSWYSSLPFLLLESACSLTL